jgi:hypothetical protein
MLWGDDHRRYASEPEEHEGVEYVQRADHQTTRCQQSKSDKLREEDDEEAGDSTDHPVAKRGSGRRLSQLSAHFGSEAAWRTGSRRCRKGNPM